MAEIKAKKVILKSRDGEWLIPYTNSGGGLEIGDIGIAPLGIDETKGKRRYLNGQVIIQEQYQVFADKVKSAIVLYPNLACSEEDWQATATLSAFGQCGKFVVDDVAGTIRLPKITGFIQGLNDLASLGSLVEAGLPNVEGSVEAGYWSIDYYDGIGCFRTYVHGNGHVPTSQGATGNPNSFSLDASLSSSIYGNSDTVQPESIRYPYFIQIATGSETEDNIINEIELNNPFSLLDYKYSEYELNNLSWLRSNGQYNSKAIYPAVYDLLLKIYNGTETKAGVSVKLSTEDYTDYDFVLNTAEETFMLPIKVKLASGSAIVGNGMTLGLTDGTNYAGLGQDSTPEPRFRTQVYGSNVGATINTPTSFPARAMSIGVTTDASKSGIVTSDSGLYLYFYVGETVQNANLINAGRIEEKLADCITRQENIAYIVETYQNGTSWYNVYSNGWCEQGGYINTTTSNPTFNLLKLFKDTNYTIIACTSRSNICPTKIVSNSQFFADFGYGGSTQQGFWQACGYIR